MMVELSFMFIIILGRWILPKGNISHSALSQLLLVYLSLASDILDLLTLFNEKEIYLSPTMVYTVLLVFSLCMFQFALNLTATRGRSFYAEYDENQREILPLKPTSFHRRILGKIQHSFRKPFTGPSNHLNSTFNFEKPPVLLVANTLFEHCPTKENQEQISL